MIIRPLASLAVLLWTVPSVAQSPNPGSGGRAPNPAAVFCEQEGGRHRTIAEIGGAHGVCVLQGGSEVDAWDYFRENNRASTGASQSPNPAAVYCVEEGGAYQIVQSKGGVRGLCVLPDGRVVDAWDYFRERHSALPLRWERAAHTPFDRAAQREGGS